MEKSIIVAGVGGQGVLLVGQTLSNAANETTDKFVTYFPSYGMQKRGGTSECYVVISDEPIGVPKPKLVDYLLAFNTEAFNRFKGNVKPGGTVFLNAAEDEAESVSTNADMLVGMGEGAATDASAMNECAAADVPADTEGFKVVRVDAAKTAFNLGSSKALNLVMTGALIGYSDLMPAENVLQTIFKKLGAKHPEMNEMNEKAYSLGLEAGRRSVR
ncbi:MAG: 2-oxoacid:acceptor oxidoreductase family protein [Clostridiales Family XIII bacterium]|jgi:2-oxoglutarate ferredoxin oxidoreductase subunit gamma|nr:2-oxoacid:acceptor oxidoreductase family protein [Clostridiales Family XIII bacterium]